MAQVGGAVRRRSPRVDSPTADGFIRYRFWFRSPQTAPSAPKTKRAQAMDARCRDRGVLRRRRRDPHMDGDRGARARAPRGASPREAAARARSARRHRHDRARGGRRPGARRSPRSARSPGSSGPRGRVRRDAAIDRGAVRDHAADARLQQRDQGRVRAPPGPVGRHPADRCGHPRRSGWRDHCGHRGELPGRMRTPCGRSTASRSSRRTLRLAVFCSSRCPRVVIPGSVLSSKMRRASSRRGSAGRPRESSRSSSRRCTPASTSLRRTDRPSSPAIRGR